MKKGLKTYLLLTIGIVIIINLMSTKIFTRLDFTQDERYTLSKATKDIIKNLDSPVTLTAYFSEKIPARAKGMKEDFEDILEEYASISGGNIVYEFIDPASDPKLEQEVMQQGIMPRNINVREKDKMTVQKIYMGVVVKKDDRSEVIAFVRPEASMEYDLSTSIKKIAVIDKEIIGFVNGFGSPDLNQFSQAVRELSILYNVESVTITDTSDLRKYKTLVVNSPKDSLPDYYFNKLDQFLAMGKNIMINYDRVKGELQQQRGESVNTGLETWLLKKGIQIEEAFAIDANCASITIQQKQGYMTMMSQKEFPFIPILKNFTDHSITSGIENVMFEFASPINFKGDTTSKFTPLVKTSERAGTMSTPAYFNVQRNWKRQDFDKKDLVVGAALEGKLEGNVDSKLVVFSDGDYAISGQRGKQPDNINLMVNSIDWLSDDTGLITLRTKTITSRPIETLEDLEKSLLKYLNFLLPILLIIGFGIFNSIRNNIIKQKRTGGTYV